jgi:hypothetical protein
MATTTTNFGWDIPQSTDLVKDGATAIAALGQDIDTALVDLKGGTTGQVLAKASNTDLDFSWVAQDDSNAIQNAIMDAKGDLIGATAADTPARLAVGTNGQILTADSTAATGIKWADPAAGASDWTLLNAGGTALTGATKITVSFTAPKQLFVLMVGASSATARSFITLRPNDDSGADYSVGGFFIQPNNITTSADGIGAFSSDTDIDFGTMSNTASSVVHGSAFFDLCDKTGNKFYSVSAGGTLSGGEGHQLYTSQGLFEAGATITSIAVLSSTGNFDAGTIYVYGAN